MRQEAFTSALLDPARAVPAGLTDPQGRPAGKRFDVYRNNVAVSLTDALETGFPVLRRIVGPEFFAAMAGVFLRAHPPRSRMLTLYGDEMPTFLEGFPPVAHLPYLPDIARLELALRASYHAADAAPLAAAALTLPPERLMAARLVLAPSVRLLPSRFPIVSIWRANVETTAPMTAIGPEDALILRRDFDPEPLALPPGGGAFVAALIEGSTLATAAELAEDPTAIVSLLLSYNAVTGLSEAQP